ncbi:MAG: hypothetical protein V3V15_07750 [Sphingorhabdus sp.]
MIQDASFYLTMGAVALTSIAIVAAVSLRGWHEWIALKRAELVQQRSDEQPEIQSTASRIEVADLKERVKKLEAIAAGIEY